MGKLSYPFYEAREYIADIRENLEENDGSTICDDVLDIISDKSLSDKKKLQEIVNYMATYSLHNLTSNFNDK